MGALIDLKSFDQKKLAKIFNSAEELRSQSRSKNLKTLSGFRALLYFEQASSRTFLSFANAAQLLGMSITEIRDVSTSSISKGETIEDSFRTFSSYVDVIIARVVHEETLLKAANFFQKQKISCPLISAGHGTLGHPTQALLDTYTLWREWGGDFKKFSKSQWIFSGDLKRGRTVHSLVELLEAAKLFPNKVVFSAPIELQWDLQKRNIQKTSSFLEELKDVDVLYMTRIQNEWGGKKNPKRDLLTPKLLKTLKASAIVLHPLPRREEISPECDHDSRVKIWEQEENGLWLRAALLKSLLT